MTVNKSVATGGLPPVSGRPSAWLGRWMQAIPDGGRVVDFASGQGRNLSLLDERRAEIWAIDVDEQAVRQAAERFGLAASCAIVSDLEGAPWPLPRGAFDAVIVNRYLYRRRLALLVDLLAPAGLLIYETFSDQQPRFGRPRRADFLLQPAELIGLCQRAGLRIVAYEDGVVGRADGEGDDAPAVAHVQRICAVRPPFDAARFKLDLRVG